MKFFILVYLVTSVSNFERTKSDDFMCLLLVVIDQPLPKAASAGPVIGGIIAAIIILCLIGAGVAMYRKRTQSTANGE